MRISVKTAPVAEPWAMSTRGYRPPEERPAAFNSASTSLPRPTVDILHSEPIRRHSAVWSSGAAEVVRATLRPITMRFHAPFHLLVAYEQGGRREGEAVIAGGPRSTLRHVKRKLTFVPAGHDYTEWFEPRALPNIMFVYLSPETDPIDPALRQVIDSFPPRLFFEDPVIWETVSKLRSLVEPLNPENRSYIEAVSSVLAYELARLAAGAQSIEGPSRGGLAAWQRRVVIDFIEEHLKEEIPLSTLAKLARLSPYHFSRAFKQSLGQPPSRYHTLRRIEQAKILLGMPGCSVTDIGLSLGYSETSSFTAAFRRTTGVTPTTFRRTLS